MADEVLALGAWCDFVPEELSLASPGSVCFTVHEFAVLASGRRLTLHTERGFGISGPIRPTAADPLGGTTTEQIESGVLTTVLPDEVDTEDEHPYEWLSELLHGHGVVVSVDWLRLVPYTVEFSERLQHLLSP